MGDAAASPCCSAFIAERAETHGVLWPSDGRCTRLLWEDGLEDDFIVQAARLPTRPSPRRNRWGVAERTNRTILGAVRGPRRREREDGEVTPEGGVFEHDDGELTSLCTEGRPLAVLDL